MNNSELSSGNNPDITIFRESSYADHGTNFKIVKHKHKLFTFR